MKGALLGEAVDEAIEAATVERNRSGIVSGHNEAVLEIARRLTETLDRATILQTIVRELNHELATDAATIRILEGEELRVAAWAGMTDAEARVLPRFRHDEGWFVEVIGSGKVWSCADLRVERLFATSFERYAGQIDWCGDIVAPLTHGGRVIGAVSAVTRAPRQWTQDEVGFVSAIAAQASIAIHNAELFEKSEGLARELRGLVEMSSDLAGTLDSAHVADRIARHLAVATDVPSCRISYLDRDTNRLVALGHYPAAATWALSGGDPLDGPAARRALAEQISVDTVARHHPSGPRVQLGLLPLVAKGQSIGLVELASDRTGPLDRGRLALGRTMANEAAMALENARLYEVARNQADRDQLTGFFNHRFFHQRLGEEVVRAQRGRVPLGLLMLDIDDFKLVNDTFGHLLGDRVLQWAAEVIRGSLRLSDIPARYGGDEFAVLLPDADLEASEVVADRIRAAFAERPFELDGRGPQPIALSIGAASFPIDARGGQGLIGVADRALYRRKQAHVPATPRPARPARRDRSARTATAGPAE